jgi:hypothetical protein
MRNLSSPAVEPPLRTAIKFEEAGPKSEQGDVLDIYDTVTDQQAVTADGAGHSAQTESMCCFPPAAAFGEIPPCLRDWDSNVTFAGTLPTPSRNGGAGRKSP